jgi:hypothetical protein
MLCRLARERERAFISAISAQKTVEDLGVSFRPSRETFTDTIRFLIDSGELDAGQAPGVTCGTT